MRVQGTQINLTDWLKRPPNDATHHHNQDCENC